MADLEPVIAEADWSALAGAVTGLGRRHALVVLLTPLEPSAVEEGLLPVLPTLTHHHRVVLASVRDPALDTAGEGPRRSLTGVRRRRGRAGAAPPTADRRAAPRPWRARRGHRRRAVAAGPGRPLPRPQGPRPAVTRAPSAGRPRRRPVRGSLVRAQQNRERGERFHRTEARSHAQGPEHEAFARPTAGIGRASRRSPRGVPLTTSTDGITRAGPLTPRPGWRPGPPGARRRCRRCARVVPPPGPG